MGLTDIWGQNVIEIRTSKSQMELTFDVQEISRPLLLQWNEEEKSGKNLTWRHTRRIDGAHSLVPVKTIS